MKFNVREIGSLRIDQEISGIMMNKILVVFDYISRKIKITHFYFIKIKLWLAKRIFLLILIYNRFNGINHSNQSPKWRHYLDRTGLICADTEFLCNIPTTVRRTKKNGLSLLFGAMPCDLFVHIHRLLREWHIKQGRLERVSPMEHIVCLSWCAVILYWPCNLLNGGQFLAGSSYTSQDNDTSCCSSIRWLNCRATLMLVLSLSLITALSLGLLMVFPPGFEWMIHSKWCDWRVIFC